MQSLPVEEAYQPLLARRGLQTGVFVFLRSGVGIWGSTFHEGCDDKEIGKLVEETNNLVTSLPFNPSSDLSGDLHLAVKGIVTEYSSTGTHRKIDV